MIGFISNRQGEIDFTDKFCNHKSDIPYNFHVIFYFFCRVILGNIFNFTG